MIKTLALSISLLFLVSCGQDPISNANSNNPNFPVSVLFEIDGRKVYRFSDANNFRYFTNCTGSVSHIENCGKNCQREISVPTSIYQENIKR